MVLDDFCAWLMLIQFVQMTFAALIVKPSPCEPGPDMRQASYFLGPEWCNWHISDRILITSYYHNHVWKSKDFDILIQSTLSFAWISLNFRLAKTCIWEDTCFLVRVFPVRSLIYRAINSLRPEKARKKFLLTLIESNRWIFFNA